ncbi:unnamed protein product [Gulo gulo]|uniref:Uncharacterized protein n=1 Tax=Gulo gulo TaxID=48420 RepID=A0A9X9Q322_GULGU|nr:unnamed protein product [Gulo gulo]
MKGHTPIDKNTSGFSSSFFFFHDTFFISVLFWIWFWFRLSFGNSADLPATPLVIF